MVEVMNRILLIISLLILTCCAYDFQQEANYTWEIMQERIPECRDKVMPKIFIDGRLPVMGIYMEKHNLIVLKYAYHDVLEHEFHHACGDMLSENYQPIEVGGDWRRK